MIPFKERPGSESHIGVEGTWRRARGILYLPGSTTHLKITVDLQRRNFCDFFFCAPDIAKTSI